MQPGGTDSSGGRLGQRALRGIPRWAVSPRLGVVPDISEVDAVVAEFRQELGVGPVEPVDPADLCGRLGVELRLGSIADGDLQGLLQPLEDNRFAIGVNVTPRGGWNDLNPTLQNDVARHRLRFLLAHELAHTLFYGPGDPRPLRRVRGSLDQEEFCDRFAGALLVPGQAARKKPIHPESIIELQRDFDVSVELATRALIDAYGGRPLAWLVVLRQDAEPVIQWRPPNALAARRPWRTLEEIIENVRVGEHHTSAPLNWRDGSKTMAHAAFLAERHQLVVTAVPPPHLQITAAGPGHRKQRRPAFADS